MKDKPDLRCKSCGEPLEMEWQTILPGSAEGGWAVEACRCEQDAREDAWQDGYEAGFSAGYDTGASDTYLEE